MFDKGRVVICYFGEGAASEAGMVFFIAYSFFTFFFLLIAFHYFNENIDILIFNQALG